MRPSFPLLILSGATPGPFYHSHPHVPAEFDQCDFTVAGQTRQNIVTIRTIGESVLDVELPFKWPREDTDFLRQPQLVNWMNTKHNIDGDKTPNFVERVRKSSSAMRDACKEHGMDDYEVLGTFATGGNVSDRRFLLETFAMFGMQGNGNVGMQGPMQMIKIDIKNQYDPQYFMPYVPAYLVCGQGDLALFKVTAASPSSPTPVSGKEQTEALLRNLLVVLESLGATFEDTILVWNRVEDLDTNENNVLMTRDKVGLHRPLAESVLEVVDEDRNDRAHDGAPIMLEYIVMAQVPQRD